MVRRNIMCKRKRDCFVCGAKSEDGKACKKCGNTTIARDGMVFIHDGMDDWQIMIASNLETIIHETCVDGRVVVVKWYSSAANAHGLA